MKKALLLIGIAFVMAFLLAAGLRGTIPKGIIPREVTLRETANSFRSSPPYSPYTTGRGTSWVRTPQTRS